VVAVLPGRYLSDVASFYDVRTAWRARMFELGLHEHTVGKWRRRFLQDRCDGLLDEARPGRPRTIDDDQVAAVIERTLRTTPVDATHWSIRSMATETGFSHTTIRRMWVAFGLQPHRSQTFKLSNDPLFVDKVRDIVGLYLSPPNRALVLSIDEKSQIQALDREQPVLPMMPGVPERRTHSYVQHGTTSLFAALDVASGFVIGKCYKRHRAAEFLNFLKEIDAQVPEALDIHIVMDNYATHKAPKIRAWLARRPHYHVHFTPTSASWTNQVEHWFAELTRKRPAARRSYLRQATRSRHPLFHRPAQPKSQALQMDQICRPNPGFR
jgi:transposase